MGNANSALRFLIHDLSNKLLVAKMQLEIITSGEKPVQLQDLKLVESFIDRSTELLSSAKDVLKENSKGEEVHASLGTRVNVWDFYNGVLVPSYNNLARRYGVTINLRTNFSADDRNKFCLVDEEDGERARENFVENSLKAGATKINISWQLHKSYILLEYTDNGRGVSKGEVHNINLQQQELIPGAGGEGTKFIFDYAKRIKYFTYYDSEEGKGIKITVVIPLE